MRSTMKTLRYALPKCRNMLVLALGFYLVSCASSKKGPDYLSNSTLILTTVGTVVSHDTVPTYAIDAAMNTDEDWFTFECNHTNRVWIALNQQHRFRDVEGPKLTSVQMFDTVSGETDAVPLRDSQDAPCYALVFPYYGSYTVTLNENYWEVDTVEGLAASGSTSVHDGVVSRY